jgi:hypothetical protein
MIRPQPKPEPRPKKARRPMKRTRIRSRRPRRLDTAQSDPARLAFVREQACVVPFSETLPGSGFAVTGGCKGRTEACHEGKKPGIGMKCNDAETLPMCSSHHGQWTDHRGVFAGWTKEQRRQWADERIAETTARYLSAGARRSGR